jgi:predicted dehydrogenase
MGRWHAQAAKYVGAKVTAIVDPNRNNAQVLAERHRTAQVFTSLEECLAACPTDVIHICTPLDSHATLIDTALRAGCHVLAEKPLALSLEETKELIALAGDRALKLNPVHQFPFQPGFLRVLKQRQRLGELVRVTYSTCSAGAIDRRTAVRRSVMLEILPHPVSLLHYLFSDGFDPSTLKVLTFTDDDLELAGQVGNTRLSIVISLRGRPTCNELQVVGTAGTAHLDLFHGYGVFEDGQVSRRAKIMKPFRFGTQLMLGAGSNLLRRALRSEPAYPGLRELVGRFYHAVINDTPAPIPDAEIVAAACLTAQVKASLLLI